MKKVLLTSVAIVTMGAGAIAVAQAVDEDGPRRGPGGEGPRWERMFEETDVNGDGGIDQDEIAAARERRFNEMDANGDGSVTADEMVEAQMLRRAERRISRLDENGDGAIQLDEFPDRSRRLARLDLDENGVITRTEVEQARPFRRGGGRYHRHGRGERGWMRFWGGDGEGRGRGPRGGDDFGDEN